MSKTLIPRVQHLADRILEWRILFAPISPIVPGRINIPPIPFRTGFRFHAGEIFLIW